ncbi:MAG: AAA family ATPase [Saprospiraceae bacterium]
MANIIGRKEEATLLNALFQSPKSEFVAVYGRRRVGKTFLIRTVFEDHFHFQLTGQARSNLKQQLLNFQDTLQSFDPGEGNKPPKSWFEAFGKLRRFLESRPPGKKVVFLDELPWLDTPQSGFVSALEHFWNSWASARRDILLIVCGSAAAWILKKLINDRGGLHNRLTERIILRPFTLQETEAFLRSKGATYDRYQLIELYMTMGGIPFYLENVRVNRSVAQNVDRMCFSPGGLLTTEYENLYRSLFERHERHTAVVEAIALKGKGLTRKEILAIANLPDSGNTSTILDELTQSGFIRQYYPFGSRRAVIYQLIDPFTLFYLTFMKGTKAAGAGAWLSQSDSPKWQAWSGYAFEYICRNHIDCIKKHLGIGGVYTEISAWRSKNAQKGAQIDLVIDRKDRIINLCEIKFSTTAYIITKAYAESLRLKIQTFKTESGTKKTVLLTFIAAHGLSSNEYSMQLVHDALDMDALFE